MGERFTRFRTEIEKQMEDRRQVVAQARRQFDELKESLGHFNQESAFDHVAFYINRQSLLALGHFVVETISEANGSFKIRFSKVANNPEDVPYAAADLQIVANWSLSPVIENDQFKWGVAELNNRTYTNEELADEVAVHMTELMQ